MIETLCVALNDFPPSVNNIYYSVNGRRVLKEKQVAFRAAVRAELIGKKLSTKWDFVDVDLILTPTTKLRRDVDNYTKAVFDAITNSGFWRDDSIVSSVSVQFTSPQKKPRTLIFFRKSNKKYQWLGDCLNAIGVEKSSIKFVNKEVELDF